MNKTYTKSKARVLPTVPQLMHNLQECIAYSLKHDDTLPDTIVRAYGLALVGEWHAAYEAWVYPDNDDPPYVDLCVAIFRAHSLEIIKQRSLDEERPQRYSPDSVRLRLAMQRNLIRYIQRVTSDDPNP